MRRSRRFRAGWIMLLSAALVVGLGIGVAGAVASPTVSPGAAGQPAQANLSTTTFGLGDVGYQSTEFFLSGNASSYHSLGGAALTANGMWTVEADATQQAFKTRIQVYRPTDAAAFNGTVYVEWLNVSNLADSAADWLLTHDEIVRTGGVYVGVTAQAVGVSAARTSEPGRYGADPGANLVHPGDSFSYDIFSQAGQAIRDSHATILGGLTPGKVLALGESQSANRMATYIDALGVADHVYDGYFVHSRIGNAAALRAAAAGGAINAPANLLIRTDIGVPVFTVQTETDSRTIRQPDSSVFRDWEIAGATHASMYTLGIGQADTGTTNTAAVQLFQAMLHPTNEPLPGILPPCSAPVNAGPDHWSVQAGLHALREWVTNGTAPAPSLYQATAGDVPSAGVLLDGNLNVQGGVRNPHVDVPVATLRGVGQTGAAFCSLFGTTTPFGADKINGLYSSHADFVTKWNQSVDSQVTLGYLLAADAPFLKFSAADSNVGLRVPGTPSVTGVAPADRALVVSFSPPGTPDDNKISAYTATCTDGAASTGTATGSSSPITVSGLTDGNAHTCTVRATNPIGDGLESAASASTTVGVAPVVTITTPPDGAVYNLHQNVAAAYGCTDAGGSGLASCVGPVANGTPIATSAVGPAAFTVNAADNAGNTASATNDYRVKYVFAGFRSPFDKNPCDEFNPSGKTIEFRLTDANGVTVGTAHATVTLAMLVNGLPGTEFDATPKNGSGNDFSYDAKRGVYTYELKTKDLDKNGTYRLTVRTDDDEAHTVLISSAKGGCPKAPTP